MPFVTCLSLTALSCTLYLLLALSEGQHKRGGLQEGQRGNVRRRWQALLKEVLWRSFPLMPPSFGYGWTGVVDVLPFMQLQERAFGCPRTMDFSVRRTQEAFHGPQRSDQAPTRPAFR